MLGEGPAVPWRDGGERERRTRRNGLVTGELTEERNWMALPDPLPVMPRGLLDCAPGSAHHPGLICRDSTC